MSLIVKLRPSGKIGDDLITWRVGKLFHSRKKQNQKTKTRQEFWVIMEAGNSVIEKMAKGAETAGNSHAENKAQ